MATFVLTLIGFCVVVLGLTAMALLWGRFALGSCGGVGCGSSVETSDEAGASRHLSLGDEHVGNASQSGVGFRAWVEPAPRRVKLTINRR